MGDHRASIKIEFEMYGEKKKADMWINWSPDSSECHDVDQRVIDFFREESLSMRAKYDEEMFDYHAEREKQAKEEAERAEFDRLFAKYGRTA